MSYQEKADFIEKLRHAVQSYQGFTQTEKCYADKYLPEWIGTKGELDIFIKKFAKLSLDIRPFLNEKYFLVQNKTMEKVA